ncbi:unnamed protein product [Brassica oleracea var. botrytis]
MFPKWEFDVEDPLAENIIKLMFSAVVSPAKKKVVKEDRKDLGRALRISSICRKGWKLWRRRLVSPQNGKGHHLKTLPLHLNRRSNPGVKVSMGRTREGRAWRRIKLQNRALFYWTKINPLFQICRRRMLDI